MLVELVPFLHLVGVRISTCYWEHVPPAALLATSTPLEQENSMSNQIGPSTGTGPDGVYVLLVCRESRRRKDDSETSDNLETQEAKLREWAKQNIPGLKGIEVLNLVAVNQKRRRSAGRAKK